MPSRRTNNFFWKWAWPRSRDPTIFGIRSNISPYLRSRTRDLLITSPTPYRYTTESAISTDRLTGRFTQVRYIRDKALSSTSNRLLMNSFSNYCTVLFYMVWKHFQQKNPWAAHCLFVALLSNSQFTCHAVSSGSSQSHPVPSRQRLRSSSSDDLLVPAVRLPTIGRRSFLVAGARTWNDLPVDVTSAPSLLSVHLQKTTKTASISTFISWPSHTNYCYSARSLR